ncbi:MAG: CoA-binding protein, partial [Bacteroidales bacterium]|nr:CoA-binding protein [Bacteroidales bacterium]
MINNALINPHSIVVVGGSENLQKPGGAVLRNIIDGGYQGELLVVNKRYDSVAGCPTFKDITKLPEVDLAILAIPAADCPDVVDVLCNKKGCGAVIILSSGFGEFSQEGLALEKKIAEIADSTGTTIIGPNCVGLVTPSYSGVFSRPVVKTATGGVDFISNSGTTIMFTVELAVQHGLVFSGIYCVGNSIQTGVEDILEYLDQSYVHGVSAPVKMLYIESMSNPEKFLKHASSLISKGAQIAAIKSGYSEAGGRAATSHTGALISPDKAVSAMFRKAGIV